MKLLNAAAVIILAGAGCTAQAQTYAEQFKVVKPELDNLMTSMHYKEVIEKVRAIIPGEIPVFENDPTNPQAGLNKYYEMATIQDFYDILYRAHLMSGDTESAIATIKKAEEIAKQNAADIEAALTPVIGAWSNQIEELKKNLEDVADFKKQAGEKKTELEARKTEIGAKSKPSSKEKKELSQIETNITAIQEKLTLADNDVATLEASLKQANGAVQQLNKVINDAKRDATKFAQDIKDMESDFDNEKEQIEKFSGNKAKYVEAVLHDKDNFANKGQKDVVKILNRLLFLNPKSADVQKQLDTALKAE